MIKLLRDPKLHYNHISEPWRYILGDNFHFGYFNSSEKTLKEATDRLTDKLAELCHIDSNSHVLDAGCGIGGPAIYLHEKYGCEITGITTSEKGVELASKACKDKNYSHKIKFILADAQDNGLPDNYFDVVWVMESSHLMKHKRQMFKESYRVLKPGGVFLLCDMISKLKIQLLQLKYLPKLINSLKTFGLARIETIEFYTKELKNINFKNIETFDISDNMFLTFDNWRNNLRKNHNLISSYLTEKEIHTWFKSLDALEFAFSKNLAGYGMIKAVKY